MAYSYGGQTLIPGRQLPARAHVLQRPQALLLRGPRLGMTAAEAFRAGESDCGEIGLEDPAVTRRRAETRR